MKVDYSNTHKEIIEGTKNNNRLAQYQLYQLYAKAMYNICYRMMNNREDSKDMLQESFSEAFYKISSFRYESSFGAWLKQIVINKWINTLKINSKSSILEIESVGQLTLDSRRDKFNIEKVDNINGKGTFSKFYLEKLISELDLDLKYGIVDIKDINRKFSNIFIKSYYTDIDLKFERGSSYKIDVNRKKGSFYYPKDIAKVKTSTIDAKAEIVSTIGHIGSIPNPASKVKIVAENGNLRIFHE